MFRRSIQLLALAATAAVGHPIAPLGGIGEDRQIAIEEEGTLELVRLHEPLELCRGRRRVLQEACRRFARAPQPLVEDLIESADRPGMEEGRRG